LCGDAEPATGLTFYADAVLRAAPKPAAPPSVFLPAGTPPVVGAGLRAQKFVTIAGLAPVDNVAVEARRLGCTHILSGTQAEEF
jgi:ATP phosphoribosyltransferase regulatory subunit